MADGVAVNINNLTELPQVICTRGIWLRIYVKCELCSVGYYIISMIFPPMVHMARMVVSFDGYHSNFREIYYDNIGLYIIDNKIDLYNDMSSVYKLIRTITVDVEHMINLRDRTHKARNTITFYHRSYGN